MSNDKIKKRLGFYFFSYEKTLKGRDLKDGFSQRKKDNAWKTLFSLEKKVKSSLRDGKVKKVLKAFNKKPIKEPSF